ncbi:MAG: YHS domain-containing protein [Planctomycetota bacterium]|jgi:YHS domain-containing protein
MKLISSYLFTLLAGLMALTTVAAQAGSVTAIGGYDAVSYHNAKRPVRGNGHFLTVHDDVTYLFSNKENQATFEANPAQYVPAYGGYCAFGASVGKKFVGDPEVWRLVDNKLYLNLDVEIQSMWLKDVPGRIKTADAKWLKIKNVPAAEL